MQTLRSVLACLLLAVAPPLSAAVILHAFNWPYREVLAKADEIAARGYDAVLLAPPLKSEGTAWWARYQPQDYRVVEHPLGNSEDLRALAARLGALGVELHADLVLNHMANEAWRRPDLDYPGQRVLAQYAADAAYYERQRLWGDLALNLYGAADFHPPACIRDYLDPVQVQMLRLCGGGGDPGLPDLTDHERVVASQRAWIAALRALGFSGFRIDAAKHMTIKQVWRILGDLDPALTVYGELITGGGGEAEYELYLRPWLELTPHAAYDFPLHAALRRGFGFGGDLGWLAQVASNGQALPGARAVTFALTHDMPNNAGFRGLLLDPVDETLAYAFLFGRDGGSPLVYSDHDESGDGRWVEAWRRADLGAMIAFHHAVAGSDQQWLASGPCHLAFRRGSRGLVAINKCGHPVEFAIAVSADKLWWSTPYRDVLAGGTLVIDRRPQTLVLPARSARMWLRDPPAPARTGRR